MILTGLATSACYDDIRPPWVLTDDPVVMGISLAVVEDGPYAANLASVPPDRPRAEVLPLDIVELDALVANVDGPVPLDDAAWVLCGAGCLQSLQDQGRRFGELPDCHEGSVVEALACLAGRGTRPQVVIPDLVRPDALPPSFRWWLYPRVLLVSGRDGGPTTDACLDQLVVGPARDLVGCAIGASDLVYGPAWVFDELLKAAGLHVPDPFDAAPAEVLELIPPNTAAVFEQVRMGPLPSDWGGPFNENDDAVAALPLFSIDEVLEIDANADVLIVPEVQIRDQQLVLTRQGPDAWLGRSERHRYQEWIDDPEVELEGPLYGYSSAFVLRTPPGGRTFDVHVKATDRPGNAVSWFTLTVRVVDR